MDAEHCPWLFMYKLYTDQRNFEAALQLSTSFLRRDSRVLSHFPWNLDVIGMKDLSEIFPDGNSFHQFARSVEDCEKWIRTSPSQSMFALQQVLVVNEEFAMTPTGTEPLTNLTDMTPGSAGDLCNLLMLYRLVEVMAITSGKTSRERVPRHYRFPGLSDPKFKLWERLHQWPKLLFDFKRNFSNLATVDSIHRKSDSGTDVLLNLWKQVSGLVGMKGWVKISLNFTLAAMHLAYLLKTKFHKEIPDLPISLSSDLEKMKSDGTINQDTFDTLQTLLQGSDPGLRLRNPLVVSALVTPLLLLTASPLQKSVFERRALIRTSKALGNDKPALLSRVELLIWKALINTAEGKICPLAALQSLKDDIPWADVAVCGDTDRRWFISDGSQTEVSLHQNYFVGEINDEWPLASGIVQPGALRGALEPAPKELPHLLLGSTPGGSQRPTSPPLRGHSGPPTPGPSGPPTPGPSGRNSPPAKEPVRERSQRPVQLDRPHGTPERDQPTAPREKSGKNDKGPAKDQKVASKKRKGKRTRRTKQPSSTSLSSLSLTSLSSLPLPEYSMAESFYEMQVEDEINLPNEPLSEKIESLRSFTVWDAKGKAVTIKPALHHKSDLDNLESLFDSIHLVEGQPLHVKRPAESVFKILPENEFLRMSTECVQELIRSQNVVLTDCEVDIVNFDAQGLSSLKRTGAIIELQGKRIFSITHSITELPCNADQSIAASANLQSRVKKGTLDMMLREATSANGRILNALDFPMPHTGVDWKSSFASDRVAWSLTEGCCMCQRDDSFPSSDMFWGLAATKGACHGFHVDCNGLATVVETMCGAKVWFVARPIDSTEIPLSEWNIYTTPFNVQRPGHLNCWMEAMYLSPGTRLLMRPNTPHAVFTPDNAICYGNHYFSTSNLQDTLFGIIHCFVANRLITNTDHAPSRRLLQRLMAYFFEALVRGSLLSADIDWAHIPDLTKFQSLIDLLSLCIVLILQNVLDPETYIADGAHNKEHASICRVAWDSNSMPSEERLRVTHARGMAYLMLEWLDSNFYVVNSEEDELDILKDIFYPYLGRVIICLQKAKRAADRNHVMGLHNCSFKDVHHQLSLAFHSSHELSTALEAIEIDDVDSMAFEEQNEYEVLEQGKHNIDHDWNRVRLAGETAGDLLYQHGDIQGWKLEDSHYELYEKFRKLEQDDLPIWTKPADSWYHISKPESDKSNGGDDEDDGKDDDEEEGEKEDKDERPPRKKAKRI